MTDINRQLSDQFPTLNESDREAIALDYLRELTPGFQKLEVFTELARLGGLDTVEVVPVRTSPDNDVSTEVLLVRRPDDDKFWPGLLHVAGSVIREDDPIAHEHDYDPALSRAMQEMGTLSFTHEPIELETVHRRGRRSREVTVRFWGEVVGHTDAGEFYDVADVLRRAPELGIKNSHAALIERVADAYQVFKTDRDG